MIKRKNSYRGYSLSDDKEKGASKLRARENLWRHVEDPPVARLSLHGGESQNRPGG
jgi:hypothetical protein